jgi:hypothetical protein
MGGGAGASFKATAPSQIRPAGPNEHYPKFKSLEAQAGKAAPKLEVSGLKKVAVSTKTVEGKSLKDRFAKFNEVAKKLQQRQVERENAHLDVVAAPRLKEASTAKPKAHAAAAAAPSKKERFAAFNKLAKSMAAPRFRSTSAALVKVQRSPPSKDQKERFAAFNKLAKKLAKKGAAPASNTAKETSEAQKAPTKLAPAAANAFYKKYAEKPKAKATPTHTKMLDAAAINTNRASLIPRFSTQRAQAQQAQQVAQRAQAGSPGMMTFEYYDPHKPPPWLAPPWNRHEAGNNVNAMPQGLPQGMGQPSVQNSMVPNGGAAFGTRGAPGVPFAYAPVGQVNQQQFVGSPHLNAPPMTMRL